MQVSFDTLPQIVPHLKTGALRGLAITSPKRVAPAPDVPSVNKSVRAEVGEYAPVPKAAHIKVD